MINDEAIGERWATLYPIASSQGVGKPTRHLVSPRNDAAGQHGALFGLDARLALMIFAILAVVAGYVAFGRLEAAKQAALMGELQAFEQALAHYQTDMGTFYLFTLNKPEEEAVSGEDVAALWDKSKLKEGFQARWNGPYLARENPKSRNFGTYSIFYAQSNREDACDAAAVCHIWLSLGQVPSPLWEAVNKNYDEGGGKYPEKAEARMNAGRVQAEGSGPTRTLLLKLEGRPQ